MLLQITKRKIGNSAGPVLGPRPRDRAEIMRERPRYASRLGFIITETCNIRCSHCLPESDASKRKGIAWPTLERAIREAGASGIVDTVSFTGGEPFVRFALLSLAVGLCRELGLQSTVMTNGFWARNVSRATEVLRKLDGLTRLGLSTDIFHQPFVSVERIRDAIIAGNNLGIACAVRVCHLTDPDGEIERVRQQLDAVKGL